MLSLLTDFGHRDAYVGIMKAVVWGIAPGVPIVDLCHEIPPQDLRRGALVLWSAVDAFGPGSVHVVVVDPGVGSARRAVAVEAGGQYFVAPDNGVLWPAITRLGAWRAVVLDDERWFRTPLSATFHGRDLFSPVGAHLAAGRALDELGSPTGQLEGLSMMEFEEREDGIAGQLIHFDHFGNGLTNIPGEKLRGRACTIEVGELRVSQVRATFSDVAVGEVVAYIDSFGLLEFAVRDGDFRRRSGLRLEQPVRVRWT